MPDEHRGKQVRATDLLGGMRTSATDLMDRATPPSLERRIDRPVTPASTPAPEPKARAPKKVEEPSPSRRLKPTALKLPAPITDELRLAMIWLRAHGQWDASMSQIAQAGIRHELDHLKRLHGIKSFEMPE